MLRELGLDSFVDAVERTEVKFERPLSGVSYSDRDLMGGSVYRLHSVDDEMTQNKLKNLSSSYVTINTLPDLSLRTENSYYVESLEVLLPLIDVHLEYGDNVFVINPALSLRFNSEGGRLPETLEALLGYTYKKRAQGLVVILVDLDVVDGKSESRVCINNYTLGTLY